MYLMQVPDSYESNGEVFGHQVVGRTVLVQKQFWWNFFLQQGFRDITPAGWLKSRNKPTDVKTVLHFHHGGIGDVMFTIPAITAYKKKYPETEHTYATTLVASYALQGNPDINYFRLEQGHTAGLFQDIYDDVISYDCAVAGNPEAGIKNIYDIVIEWAGVECSDEEKIPKITLAPEEVKAITGKLEKEFGINRRDNVIIIQPESSTNIRNISLDTTFELAEMLVASGSKVILFGQSIFGIIKLRVCTSCGKKKYAHISDSVKSFITKCECGADVEYSATDETIKDVYTFQNWQLREIIGAVAQADGFIGVDTCGNHFAAAFNIPSLGLFSCFDGDLRLRYYPKATWIQKPYRCAPSFIHHIECRWKIEKNTPVPPCMMQFTAKEIFDVWKEHEQNCRENKPIQKPSPFISMENIRPCPICSNKGRKLVARKGSVIYYDCISCGTTYADKVLEDISFYNDEDYWKCYEREEYKSSEKYMGQLMTQTLAPRYSWHGKILEVGCGTCLKLNEMRRLGWDVAGVEPSSIAIAKGVGWGNDLGDRIKNISFEQFETEEKYDVISFYHSLEHFPDIRGVITKAIGMLRTGGCISIVIPYTDKWQKLNNKFPHINAYYPGEHSILMPSGVAVNLFTTQGMDVEILHTDLDGSNAIWFIAKRKGE